MDEEDRKLLLETIVKLTALLLIDKMGEVIRRQNDMRYICERAVREGHECIDDHPVHGHICCERWLNEHPEGDEEEGKREDKDSSDWEF